jgi:hypothetical protein
MLRLAGRCLLPLVIWFTAGEIARYGLLVAAAEVSHGQSPQLRYALAVLLFIIVIMVWIVVTVGMLRSLREPLREMRARRVAERPDERLPDVLFRIAIPFAVLYFAWGGYMGDAREFVQLGVQSQSAAYGSATTWDAIGAGGGTPGQALIGLSLLNAAVIMGVAFLLRFLFVWWYERKAARVAALGAVFAELAVFYYGVEVVTSQSDWVGDRAFMAWLGDARETLAQHVPGWEAVWGFAGDYWSFAWEALVLPAVWLTVAILVYGAYAEDTQTVIAGTRIEDHADRWRRVVAGRTHSSTRRMLGRFFGRWAHWVPIANTFRLAVRGGAPLFGLFALCFVAIQVGDGYARRGLVYLIGADRPTLEWNVWFVPIGFVVELGVTVLTVCLLAATFDLAATRHRATLAAREAPALSGRSAAPDPSPVSPSATAPTRPARPPSPVPR